MLAISEMTPGPFAINSATFIGYRLAGFSSLPHVGVITLPLSWRFWHTCSSAFNQWVQAALPPASRRYQLNCRCRILVSRHQVNLCCHRPRYLCLTGVKFTSILILALSALAGIIINLFRIHPGYFKSFHFLFAFRFRWVYNMVTTVFSFVGNLEPCLLDFV